MVNGRPGYAWYFGRDAAWCAFAIDDYGDFATVRRQLEFFRDYQDLNGKIFHELSASGVVHYDAADSTPLYVILAADYLRHSGDLATIRVLWPSLVRAMDFLYSTDTDGDLLIENTDVGHGWVEGGPLSGANTTFYLAGLWARSLEDAAYIAGAIGEEGRARLFVDDAADVFAQLEADFWNEDGRFYAHGRNADGSFNPARTVLPAPVAWLNPLPAERIAPALDAYASDEFSTDWGVRILSADSPDYNPGSYHGGAVWPLFTGWAALAEYKYGRAQAGFRHMMSNLRIKDRWARGYVEEVLHGAEYKPYGVCPHQGWSETGALHPAIDGLLGWEPDALAGRARIAPQLPADWDTLTVNNLRVGGTTLSLNLWRERGRIEWDVADRSGPPVEITMESPLGKRGTGADSEHDE
ncbi:MAG: hypothetical protein MAG453_01226 [Calditrichaeota bacterium]|nr:hypothetical protein [Calditrichota bacterium]